MLFWRITQCIYHDQHIFDAKDERSYPTLIIHLLSFTIGWLWGLEKIGKDVYNMIEIIVSIGLVVVTGLMFYSISKQVKYSGDILGKEMKQLNIDQGNFDMKTKLMTLEFMNLFEKREAYNKLQRNYIYD